MSRQPKHSLYVRLTFSFISVIVITVTLTAIFAFVTTKARFTYMISVIGQRYAENLAPRFADYYIKQGSWEGLQEVFEDLEARPLAQRRLFPQPQRADAILERLASGQERMLLLDNSGQVIFDSQPDGKAFRLSPTKQKRGAPVMVNNEKVAILIIASSIGNLNPFQLAYLREISLLLLIDGVVAILAGAAVSWWQARRIVKPVIALSEATHSVSEGDYSQRIPVTSNDELGDMAAAFNTMAAELEHQQELRHRTTADIAHELRTPLSVLQIELESIEDGLTEPTGEVIGGLQSQVVHLKHLVEDLRTLSLTDAGELQLDMAPLDAGALVRQVVQRISITAQDKGVTLSVQLPETPLPVLGDDQRLSQVLINLLSNALRHTPPGGEVTTSATLESSKVKIKVKDTGEGIPTKDLPHIFKRFYRTDRARTGSGSGLGLSIAKSLVEAHGGRIWAQSTEGEGATFTFVLPGREEGRDPTEIHGGDTEIH